MRKLYVDDDPDKNDLSALETLGTIGGYDATHIGFHAGFCRQVQARGYRDIISVRSKGKPAVFDEQIGRFWYQFYC